MPGEGIGSPGAGIIGGWELPDMGVGNQMQFFFFFFFETKHLFPSACPLVPTLKTEFLVQRVREPFLAERSGAVLTLHGGRGKVSRRTQSTPNC